MQILLVTMTPSNTHTHTHTHTHTSLSLSQVSVNKTFVKYSFQNIDVVHTYNVYHGIESFHSYPDTLQAFRGRGNTRILLIKLRNVLLTHNVLKMF